MYEELLGNCKIHENIMIELEQPHTSHVLCFFMQKECIIIRQDERKKKKKLKRKRFII